jgi:hypothetical protein
MRLSRSMSVEAGLVCGFLLTALTVAAPSSLAEAKNHAPVSRYLTFHHKSVDPRATAHVPATPVLFPASAMAGPDRGHVTLDPERGNSQGSYRGVP